VTEDYLVQATAGKQTKECAVEVEPLAPAAAGAPARFRISIDEKEALLEACRVDERGNVVSWSLLDKDGRQRLFDVDSTLAELRISAGGEPVQVKVSDRRSLSAAASTTGSLDSGDMRAAMPGKVVKLLCKVGDVVKAGQGLLVIEAMKMENELRASAAGKVTALNVREGQNVEAGQALVTLSPV